MNSSTMAGNLTEPLSNKGTISFKNDGNFPYMMNKVVIAVIVVFFFVTVLVVVLQIYAKWFWRYSYRTSGSASLRRGGSLQFTEDEESQIIKPVGLEKAIIESLPTFFYKVPQSDDEVLECAVCLCEFQENEQGRLLPKCHHSFHTDCIDMWFSSHSTCPICRSSVTNPRLIIIDSDQEVHGMSTEHAALLSIPQQVDLLDENLASLQAPEFEQLRLECGRDTSQRLQQHQSLQYPTNVLFWGDSTHVSSRVSSPQFEHGQPAGRSISHIVVDIPRRSACFRAHRCLSTTSIPRRGTKFPSPRCLSIKEQSCTSNNEQCCSSSSEPITSSMPHLKNLKRLLSRDRNIFSTEHGANYDQLEAISALSI